MLLKCSVKCHGKHHASYLKYGRRRVSVVLGHQVPVEVRPERRTTLDSSLQQSLVNGEQWLIVLQRNLDAANNIGAAVKKREDTHRMAEANRTSAGNK